MALVRSTTTTKATSTVICPSSQKRVGRGWSLRCVCPAPLRQLLLMVHILSTMLGIEEVSDDHVEVPAFSDGG